MDIIEIKNHGYIKLIEFTLKNNKFSKDSACKVSGLSHKQFDFIKDNLFILSEHQKQNASNNIEQEWELTPETYFSYLQYLEFKHAVRSSHTAKYIAIAAIVISGMLALASLFNCT